MSNGTGDPGIVSEAQVLTTLGALIAPELAADPSRVAVVEASRHVTFAELDHEADRVAAALIALGLKSGDRVLLWMESCAEWLGTALGIARAGCTLVTLDAAAGPSELARALGQTHAKVVFLSARPIRGDRLHALKEVAPQCFRGEPGATHSADLPELRAVAVTGNDVPDGCFAVTAVLGLGRSISRDRLVARIVRCDPHDTAWIAYGSALDGRHRGVMLSHAALGQRIGWMARLAGPAAGTTLLAGSLTDVSAAVAGSFTALWRGAAQVVAESADLGEVLAWIPRVSASEIVLPPYAARVLLRHPDRGRWGVARLGVRVLHPAHLAIDPVGTQTEPDPSLDLVELVCATEAGGPFATAWPPESSGMLAGLEARIANPAADGSGLLEIRGEGLMQGYQGDDAASLRVLAEDGWLALPVPAVIGEGGRMRFDTGTAAVPRGSVGYVSGDPFPMPS